MWKWLSAKGCKNSLSPKRLFGGRSKVSDSIDNSASRVSSLPSNLQSWYGIFRIIYQSVDKEVFIWAIECQTRHLLKIYKGKLNRERYLSTLPWIMDLCYEVLREGSRGASTRDSQSKADIQKAARKKVANDPQKRNDSKVKIFESSQLLIEMNAVLLAPWGTQLSACLFAPTCQFWRSHIWNTSSKMH